jgi:hypothetical protein
MSPLGGRELEGPSDRLTWLRFGCELPLCEVQRKHAVVAAVPAAAVAAGVVGWFFLSGEGSRPMPAVQRPAASPVLQLPAKSLSVQGVFDGILAQGTRAIPLLMQPESCSPALLWDAATSSRARIQPWPGCKKKHRYIVKVAAGWDSYFFTGALAGRFVVLVANWNVSDSCATVLNRVVLPRRTGDTLATFESGCFFVGEFTKKEKSVRNFTSAGDSVYFNRYAARPHRSRRETMQEPAVLRLRPKGPPRRIAGVQGVLEDVVGDRMLVRVGRTLRLASLRESGARPLAFPGGSSEALGGDRLVVDQHGAAVVYETATGRRVGVRPLRRDPFRAPNHPDFGRTPTPPPEILDADGGLIVYASGRRLELMRLSDGYYATILESAFNEESLEFPLFSARFTDAGLFYGVSSRTSLTSAAARGRIYFVPRVELEAALP